MKVGKVNLSFTGEDFFKRAVEVIEELVKLANLKISPEEITKLVKQVASYILASVWNRGKLKAKWSKNITNARQSLSGVKKASEGKKNADQKKGSHQDGSKSCKRSVGKKK